MAKNDDVIAGILLGLLGLGFLAALSKKRCIYCQQENERNVTHCIRCGRELQ